MPRAPAGGHAGVLARPIDRRPFQSPAGLKMMIPGWAQFSWGQHECAWVLAGSFAAALGVALWTWGTWLGWGCFAFAFVAHVTSATDVLRQSTFPFYPSRSGLLFVSGALGLVFYFPALLVLSVMARPGFEPTAPGSGFLINCWAYQGGEEPREGHWIWMKLPPLGEQLAGRVVAVSGQEVEWTGRQWRVDGKSRLLHSTPRLSAWPQACRFTVPSHQVLVEPADDGAATEGLGPLVLVPPDRIIGRAWAHFYPVWDRRLL